MRIEIGVWGGRYEVSVVPALNVVSESVLRSVFPGLDVGRPSNDRHEECSLIHCVGESQARVVRDYLVGNCRVGECVILS